MALQVIREYRIDDGTPVRILASTRRNKSVAAKWRGAAIEVTVPAWMSEDAQARHVDSLLRRMRSKRGLAAHRRSDDALLQRARRLDVEYLHGLARPEVVRWVTNQNSRWASATSARKSIRVSHRLKGAPDYVLDAVLVHELSHLIATDGHGPQFRALERRYPRLEEANAFLAGASFAWGTATGDSTPGLDDDPDEDDPDDEDADGPDADGSDTAESAGPAPGSRPNADGLDLNGWL
ncbi:YgjP-like metallopeptidase domain-containing protein [Zhihengliuella sp.]|uniref:M48 metallopeptidase family protein n=1 Tax=Zhihengliuella sp. TaxID=1954483 RepID=UPI00281104F6|nr:YgjP-like metallopeptidase domain-containing protein [Zhihengliuella sp.]